MSLIADHRHLLSEEERYELEDVSRAVAWAEEDFWRAGTPEHQQERDDAVLEKWRRNELRSAISSWGDSATDLSTRTLAAADSLEGAVRGIFNQAVFGGDNDTADRAVDLMNRMNDLVNKVNDSSVKLKAIVKEVLEKLDNSGSVDGFLRDRKKDLEKLDEGGEEHNENAEEAELLFGIFILFILTHGDQTCDYVKKDWCELIARPECPPHQSPVIPCEYVDENGHPWPTGLPDPGGGGGGGGGAVEDIPPEYEGAIIVSNDDGSIAEVHFDDGRKVLHKDNGTREWYDESGERVRVDLPTGFSWFKWTEEPKGQPVPFGPQPNVFETTGQPVPFGPQPNVFDTVTPEGVYPSISFDALPAEGASPEPRFESRDTPQGPEAAGPISLPGPLPPLPVSPPGAEAHASGGGGRNVQPGSGVPSRPSQQPNDSRAPKPAQARPDPTPSAPVQEKPTEERAPLDISERMQRAEDVRSRPVRRLNETIKLRWHLSGAIQNLEAASKRAYNAALVAMVVLHIDSKMRESLAAARKRFQAGEIDEREYERLTRGARARAGQVAGMPYRDFRGAVSRAHLIDVNARMAIADRLDAERVRMEDLLAEVENLDDQYVSDEALNARIEKDWLLGQQAADLAKNARQALDLVETNELVRLKSAEQSGRLFVYPGVESLDDWIDRAATDLLDSGEFVGRKPQFVRQDELEAIAAEAASRVSNARTFHEFENTPKNLKLLLHHITSNAKSNEAFFDRTRGRAAAIAGRVSLARGFSVLGSILELFGLVAPSILPGLLARGWKLFRSLRPVRAVAGLDKVRRVRHAAGSLANRVRAALDDGFLVGLDRATSAAGSVAPRTDRVTLIIDDYLESDRFLRRMENRWAKEVGQGNTMPRAEWERVYLREQRDLARTRLQRQPSAIREIRGMRAELAEGEQVLADGSRVMIDGQGRTVRLEKAEVRLISERRTRLEARVGQVGGLDVQGGHALGRQFGGVSEIPNLVPMTRRANVELLRVETEMASALKSGGTVSDYRISFDWGASLDMPRSFRVQVVVEDALGNVRQISRSILNRH